MKKYSKQTNKTFTLLHVLYFFPKKTKKFLDLFDIYLTAV
ncbi:hypothetical protein B1P86_05460 [Enterococcus faecium]|nr:hypothetical protein B1P86_05460 [Enterococcus faecium]